MVLKILGAQGERPPLAVFYGDIWPIRPALPEEPWSGRRPFFQKK